MTYLQKNLQPVHHNSPTPIPSSTLTSIYPFYILNALDTARGLSWETLSESLKDEEFTVV